MSWETKCVRNFHLFFFSRFPIAVQPHMLPFELRKFGIECFVSGYIVTFQHYGMGEQLPIVHQIRGKLANLIGHPVLVEQLRVWVFIFKVVPIIFTSVFTIEI